MVKAKINNRDQMIKIDAKHTERKEKRKTEKSHTARYKTSQYDNDVPPF
jgi:hypothetical protein